MSENRRIFSTTLIFGSSSAVQILCGIFQGKFFAVFLGPGGVGLVGLFQNILNIVATIFGLGMNASVVRELATSDHGPEHRVKSIQSLALGNIFLGVLGSICIAVFSESISAAIFKDAVSPSDIRLIAYGLTSSLLAGAGVACLQGLNRASDLAKAQSISAILSCVLNCLIIFVLNGRGVIYAVIVPTLISTLVLWFVITKRVHIFFSNSCAWAGWWEQIKLLFFFGIPLMLSAIVSIASLFLARIIITNELGINELGYYQAAWVISATYLGFVLNAMGSEYLPRLSSVINDKKMVAEFVNKQILILILFSGPVLIIFLAYSRPILSLLFSNQFYDAEKILRFQIFGDLFKLLSWPMGFVLLAQQRSKVFFLTQLCWNAIYLLTLWLGVSRHGIYSIGFAYMFAYMIQFILMFGICREAIGLRLVWRNISLHIFIFMACILVIYSSFISTLFSYFFSGAMVIAATIFSATTIYNLLKKELLIS